VNSGLIYKNRFKYIHLNHTRRNKESQDVTLKLKLTFALLFLPSLHFTANSSNDLSNQTCDIQSFSSFLLISQNCLPSGPQTLL
jgi:hypothetical protein